VETQLRETPEVLYPSLRAFNRWLEEDWGFDHEGRLIAAPMLVLASFSSVAAAPVERPALTMVHDYSTPVVHTAALGS